MSVRWTRHLLTDMHVESTWSVLASDVLEKASSTIGFKRNIKQPRMSESTLDVLENKAVGRDRGLVQERRKLQGMFITRA